jgi:hypothetical protein
MINVEAGSAIIAWYPYFRMVKKAISGLLERLIAGF